MLFTVKKTSSHWMALCLRLLTTALMAAPAAQAQGPASVYQQPSPAIRELLDAPALPRHQLSPDRQTLATLDMRRMPGIDELARPVLKLAGVRFDPATSGPQTITPVLRLRLNAPSAPLSPSPSGLSPPSPQVMFRNPELSKNIAPPLCQRQRSYWLMSTNSLAGSIVPLAGNQVNRETRQNE